MPKLTRDTTKRTIRIFWDEMMKDKRRVLAYSLIIPLNRLLYIVVTPLLFSLVVQSLITDPHNWGHPIFLLVLAAIAAIVALICTKVGFPLLWDHEEAMKTQLLRQSVGHLLRHSDQFFANRKVGSLAGDVNTFSASIISILDAVFLTASSIIVNFVFSLIIIAFMAPILVIPLALVTGYLVWHSFHALQKRSTLRFERKDRTSQLNGTVADVLGNQQLVRYFARSTPEVNQVVAERKAIERLTVQEISIITRESIIRQGTLYGFQILVMAIAVVLFTNDMITIAALIFTITYLGRLTSSLFEITPIIRSIEQGFIDSSAMTEILDESAEVTDAPDAKKLNVTHGAVKFDHVTFAYKDSTDDSVITDLNLSIQPGERIGLAGHSGGGKTTLTKLLLRFADIQDGAIRIDGQDISKVTQDSLHQAIAYVPQDAALFHRSLRENIAYGNTGASDADIYEAARQANAMEFIETLPQGLDTIVGERGVKLSGGQRQRIAIARAILKDAPILVLDEATSALDSESELLIQDALTRLMKGRTSIVIAHRLSTIAKLDRIVVLDHGKIIENDSHQALLKQKGTYAKLWSHQSGGFLDE
jgi:ATP-binding cassette, subfamily B, bacterial